MKKYQVLTNKNLAVLQCLKAFKLSDVYDALEELSRKVTAPVPLLVVDHSSEFEASLDELQQIVNLFERYKKHFTNRVAYVVSKDVQYGLGHMAHVLCSKIGVDCFPFWDIWEARDWLSESLFDGFPVTRPMTGP